MSIIIRLQNLPWSANALDIRNFFTGLQIPEGGVHIVGGELGDAFIAFSTDEDARQAFLRTDGKIKSVQIKLMLSSRTEMQRVIEQARTQSMAAFMLPAANAPISAPLPAAVPAVIPAAVPEIKRDSKERDADKKRDRNKRSRTRSKSRDRRDRSRDRKDRRHRDRSRSRSRDRRDRRRRDRSKSRNRSRDREGRRKDRGKSPKRDDKDDTSLFQRESRKAVPEIWANRQTLNIIPPAGLNDGRGLLGAFPIVDSIKHNVLDNMGGNLQNQGLNGFPGTNPIRNQPFGIGNQQSMAAARQRESWPPANVVPAGGIPLAQRKNMLDNFKRSPDNFQASQNNTRGPRDDSRRDFNVRESRERGAKAQGSQFEGRAENNGRRSRFEDVESTPIDSCISMEPFYGSYGDLRRFFNGLSINYRGIKVINDEVGKKTGACFVQFRNAQLKNEALKMNNQKLNNVNVKIQHISDKMFEEAIDRYNPRMDEGTGGEDEFGRTRPQMKPYKNPVAPEYNLKDFQCLKVEDLPTFVKEQDILHIFSQHPLISLNLHFKPKGGTVAYVKFSSKEVAKLALEEKSHHVVGAKSVTVKPCTDEEFDQMNKDQNDVLNEKPKDIGTDCLSISRLPSKTNDRDISDFFSDIGVIPTKIHLMSTHLGFTGQAYCEFETKEEAARAATKQGTVLGQDTICVLPISREEMEGVLNNSLPHPGTAPGLPLPPGTPLPVIKPETVSKDSKSEPVIQSDPLSKSELSPVIKPALPERIVEAPVKAVTTSPLNTLPTPQIQPLLRPGLPVRPLMMRDNLEDLNGPRSDLDSTSGPRGGPDSLIGSRGSRSDNLENFRGPRGSADDLSDGPDHRNTFKGPRGHDFGDPRGLPDLRDSLGGPRGNDTFNGPRRGGGPGSRMSRFGQRQSSRFNDDGPRFQSRMDEDGPRFIPSRGGNDGPRYNRGDKGFGFNPHMDDSMLEEVPGCTVFMENVPYKAGTNEILDFFDGYNCTNNVSRRYNPNNTPSAEAKVTFYNPDDAFRAVNELDGAKIWGRPIYLRQA